MKENNIPTVKLASVNFYNSTIEKAAKIALKAGYNVYSFSAGRQVRQIFFEDSDGNIGTCDCKDVFNVSFGTVHKPCRSCGTGFNIEDRTNTVTIEVLKGCLVLCPSWGLKHAKDIKKYKDFSEKAAASILDYYQIINEEA